MGDNYRFPAALSSLSSSQQYAIFLKLKMSSGIAAQFLVSKAAIYTRSSRVYQQLYAMHTGDYPMTSCAARDYSLGTEVASAMERLWHNLFIDKSPLLLSSSSPPSSSSSSSGESPLMSSTSTATIDATANQTMIINNQQEERNKQQEQAYDLLYHNPIQALYIEDFPLCCQSFLPDYILQSSLSDGDSPDNNNNNNNHVNNVNSNKYQNKLQDSGSSLIRTRSNNNNNHHHPHTSHHKYSTNSGGGSRTAGATPSTTSTTTIIDHTLATVDTSILQKRSRLKRQPY
jgi:hypothetical protein